VRWPNSLAVMKKSAVNYYCNRESTKWKPYDHEPDGGDDGVDRIESWQPPGVQLFTDSIRQTGYLPLLRCTHVPLPSQSSPSGTHSLWRRSKISNPEALSYDKAWKLSKTIDNETLLGSIHKNTAPPVISCLTQITSLSYNNETGRLPTCKGNSCGPE